MPHSGADTGSRTPARTPEAALRRAHGDACARPHAEPDRRPDRGRGTSLLPPGRPTELVRDRVAALRTLTEDLLEISRLDAGGERLDVDAIRLGVQAGRVAAHASGETVVRVVEDACVETDRRRLERVLGNLVANAHKHGRPPVVVTVEATAAGAAVTVRDHGDGFPEYLVREGPQRFRTGVPPRGTAWG